MKPLKAIILFAVAIVTLSISANAQQKQSLAVIRIESKGLPIDQQQASNLTRMEVEKLNLFDVMDPYDLVDLAKKNNLDVSNCLGKTCLIGAAKTFNVKRVITGSIENYGDKKIVVTFRLLNVENETFEKTQVEEFLNLPEEIHSMIAITLSKIFNLPSDSNLEKQLKKVSSYESAVANPGTSRLRSDGPRMGLSYLMGPSAKILQKSKDDGGFEAFPVMTQFGYQLEAQYLNQGKFQALFEFIPLVTGIDQNKFIPSLTILNGFRNNISGWEFAFGPTFAFVRTARVYELDGKTLLADNWEGRDSLHLPTSLPYPTKVQMDSRGLVSLTSGFVFAFGKTFKSGSLNIPVNIYVVPDFKGSWRTGISFGFNAKKMRM